MGMVALDPPSPAMQHTLCRGRATTEPLPAPPRRPQVNRLVLKVADKSQIGTIRAGHRPYGIGLLVAGADATGPHLFETQPSGQYFEYKAWAIGARSQAGRTYLEKHFEEFAALARRAGLDGCSIRPRFPRRMLLEWRRPR